MRAHLVLAAALLASGAAFAHPSGHDHDHGAETAYGRPGDPAKGGRVIQVLMTETDVGMAFTPARIEVDRGEQVRFVLRNRGELDHELVIGTV
ncbi:MAG TPA: hypothetical protein VEA41_09770 [Salinarimonas sp.]|nr:hypothetical protein [Salinarimonas sp.]